MIRDGYNVDNLEVAALINISRMAERYGAIVLTDQIDYEIIEKLLMLQGVFEKAQ